MVFLEGPQFKACDSEDRENPQPSSDRDSPALTGRAEESEEPEEKGEDGLMEDREDDVRSSCLSREDSSDPGEAGVRRPTRQSQEHKADMQALCRLFFFVFMLCTTRTQNKRKLFCSWVYIHDSSSPEINSLSFSQVSHETAGVQQTLPGSM